MYMNFPQKETVCEKFQIAREKVVVTVTTVTYKVAPMRTTLFRSAKVYFNFS